MTINIGDATVTEGDVGTTTAQFDVTLSSAASSEVSVDWSTADGTANSSDYEPRSGTTVFNPGETSTVIQISVLGDTATEGDEVFYVDLDNPSNAQIGDGRGRCTIVDDDDSSGEETPELDIIVPAAARGSGAGGSIWVTSLYICNTSSSTAEVTLYWLERDRSNRYSTSSQISIPPGDTKVFNDVIRNSFGMSRANGAIGVKTNQTIVVNAAILNTAGGVEFGQGFPAVPRSGALRSGESTMVVGLRHNDTHRSNIYLIDVTGNSSQVTVRLMNAHGNLIGSKTYYLDAYMPVLESLDRLGVGSVEDGSLEISVTSGAVIGGASRVNRASGDPLTLVPPSIGNGSGSVGVGGRYYGILTRTDTLRGMWLELDANAEVTGYRVEYRAGCAHYFRFYEDFSDDPVPLSRFQSGYQRTVTFSTVEGEVTYTITLDWVNEGLGFSGMFEGYGANFVGDSESCNTVFEDQDIFLGKITP